MWKRNLKFYYRRLGYEGKKIVNRVIWLCNKNEYWRPRKNRPAKGLGILLMVLVLSILGIVVKDILKTLQMSVYWQAWILKFKVTVVLFILSIVLILYIFSKIIRRK